jgi:hypothetical protein
MTRIARVCCALGCLGLLSPALGWTISGDRRVDAPPLASTPAEPVAPPLARGEVAPPVLEPTPPSPQRPDLSGFAAGTAAGVSVPDFDVPLGPLDLLGSALLPDAVDLHAGRAARRFGDAPPDDRDRRGATTPEPTTGLLLLLGLVGLERIGRPRS